MRRFAFGAVVVFIIASSGCTKPRYRVHGIVRFDGQPVAHGTIIFLGSDNQAYPVRLQGDGSYQSPPIPGGRVLVSVLGDDPKVPPRPIPGAKDMDQLANEQIKTDDAAKQGGKTPPPALSSSPTNSMVPKKFANPNQSGLAFDLTIADQEYSLDLIDQKK
jgi:hypothetical protein